MPFGSRSHAERGSGFSALCAEWAQSARLRSHAERGNEPITRSPLHPLTTLPGLKMFLGSNVCFSVRMRAKVAGVTSAAR